MNEVLTSGSANKIDEWAWLGLGESFVLNTRGPVTLQWSDFSASCRLNQERLKNDERFRGEFEQKKAALEALKGMSVWLKNPQGSISHTQLYELYRSAIYQRLGQVGEESFDVSFIAPSGPYKKFALVDCFNAQTYQDFVQVELLTGGLPLRDFRLRVPSRLLVEFTNRQGPQSEVLELHQLSTDGVLLKCSQHLWQRLRTCRQLQLYMSTRALKSATAQQSWQDFCQEVALWPANALYGQQKNEVFGLALDALKPTSRFDFGHTHDVYLFVAQSVLQESAPLLAQTIAKFMNQGKQLLLKSIERKVA